jgi:hypothetical protein
MVKVFQNSTKRCSREVPKDINSEDGNCTVCRNNGKLSIFHMAYSKKPESYISISVSDPHVHITLGLYKGTALLNQTEMH